jgi:hypothetical protein
MPDPVDDLLAQIKADNHSRAASPSPMPIPPEPEDSIDALLAELDGCTPAKPPTSQPAIQNNQSSVNQTKQLNPLNSQPAQSAPVDVATDNLLADLKTLYAEQDRAKQEQEATFKRQQRAANMRQAEAWLKALHSQSSEAAWFEEFAAKYASRIEAAMDYLGLSAD